MKQQALRLWKNDLLRGTAIFYSGTMVINFMGFLYHVIMARILGPLEYGILGSLTGLLYVVNIPVGALDLFITKIISGFTDADRLPKTHTFINRIVGLINKLVFVGFPILFVLSWPLGNFLHLSSLAGLWLIWLYFFLSLYSSIFSSVLRGLLQLLPLVAIQIIGMVVRLGLAVFLVVLLFHSHISALVGLVLATLLILLLFYRQLASVRREVPVPLNISKVSLGKIGFSGLILTGAFTAMFSLDVVLVKHFFSAFSAGLYAALATAGKIVVFASAPVGGALLPVVARKSVHPSSARKDLGLIVLLISIISGICLILFRFFSPLIVTTIFTSQFQAASAYLPLFGLAMFFYCLASMLGSFLIALNRFSAAYLAAFALFIELLLIWLFHQTLWQVVILLTAVYGLTTAVMLAFCLYATSST